MKISNDWHWRIYCGNKKCDFIFTFRASENGINNIDESYQFINYKNEKKGEKNDNSIDLSLVKIQNEKGEKEKRGQKQQERAGDA